MQVEDSILTRHISPSSLPGASLRQPGARSSAWRSLHAEPHLPVTLSDGIGFPAFLARDCDSSPSDTTPEGLVKANNVPYVHCTRTSVLRATAGKNTSYPTASFLPIESSKNIRNGPERDHDAVFLQTLVQEEEDASYLSNISYLPRFERPPGVISEFRSITLNPRTPMCMVFPTSIQDYVKSFRTSFSLENQRQKVRLSEKNCSSSENVGATPKRNALSSNNPHLSAKCIGNKGANASNDMMELLVYKVPPPNTDADVAAERTESGWNSGKVSLTHRSYSFCFSAFYSSSSTLIEDGNRGCEPLVYVPSFLPSLTQRHQEVVSPLPQGGTPGEKKRKESEEECHNNEKKRMRMSSHHEHVPLRDHARPPLLIRQEKDLGLPSNSCNDDPFSSNIETSSHLVWEERSAPRYAEPMNSMLIAQRRYITGNVGISEENLAQKSLHHKKIKSQHRNHTTPMLFDGGTPSFLSDHPSDLSHLARGAEFESMSLLLGRIQLKYRLNDLVSNSVPDDMAQPSSASTLFLMRRNTGWPPHDGKASGRGRRRSLSGITLPVGVKPPRQAQKLTSSLVDSPEPWTDTEDAILRESLSRYGANWHLAAHAVSSNKVSAPAWIGLAGARAGSVVRRSPAQCQRRWMARTTNMALLASPTSFSSQREKPAALTNNAVISATSSVGGEISCFAQEGGGNEESVIYDVASPVHQMTPEPLQTGSYHRLDGPEPLSHVPQPSNRVCTRLRKLKEISTKRRPPATAQRPGSGPTHASHSEAVHTARVNMLNVTNGVAPPRNEMWPLELLDHMKYHTAETHAMAPRDVSRGPAPRTTHPAMSSPQRPQGEAPYHPSHTMHPTPHHMYRAGPIPNKKPQYQSHAHTSVTPNVVYQASQQRISKQHHPPKERKKRSA